MERKIIYLEIDEELTSVIDKLKKAKESELHLVIPKEAALLQSVVNLKLLKRQAEKFHKTIRIITQDKVGRNLAEQVGIDSATALKDVFETSERSGEKADDLQEREELSSEIRYREQDSPIVETKEVVFERGGLVDEPAKEGQEKTKEDSSEHTVIQVGEVTEKENSFEEEGKEKKKKEGFIPSFPYKKFILITAILLFALSGFLYVYLPLTKIQLKLASEKQSSEVNLVIDKSTKEINASGAIVPATEITAEKAISKKYPATGKKNIGTKAQGTITVKNSYSSQTQTLVAGTRFEADSLIFITQSDVDVPPSEVDEGDVKAGTANVSVIAENPGDNYNIQPSTFHIPAFSGTARYDKFIGVSTKAMTGGVTKEVKIISEADITSASASFKEEAETEIKKEGDNKKKENLSVDQEGEKVTIGDLSFSKAAGQEADEFTVSARGTYYALAYDRTAINKMVYEHLKSKTVPNKQILESELTSVDLKIDEVNFEQGKISATAAAVIHLGLKLDDNQLKDEVIGNNKEKAENYLKNLEGVENVEIEFWPGFYKHVTRLKNHIYISTEFVES